MADIRLATYAELEALTARVEDLEDAVSVLDPSGEIGTISTRLTAVEESVEALEEAISEYGLTVSSEEATTANWGEISS